MEKQEAINLTKAINVLERAIASQAKEYALLNRKMDTLNDNITKLNDKIGTFIQLQQHS